MRVVDQWIQVQMRPCLLLVNRLTRLQFQNGRQKIFLLLPNPLPSLRTLSLQSLPSPCSHQKVHPKAHHPQPRHQVSMRRKQQQDPQMCQRQQHLRRHRKILDV